MIRTIIILVLFILAGCKNQSTGIHKLSHQQYEEDNIREAVFRYQFNHNESGTRQTDTVIFFLSVGTTDEFQRHWKDGDPDIELMHRFDKNNPIVRPFSLCTSSRNGIIDRETGVMGILFRVGDIKRISNYEAEVTGGYYQGNMSASGNVYYLKKNEGHWKVIRIISQWIS